MPNWFSPKLKSNPELDRKQQFLEIDVELCKMLGVPVHPEKFVNNWVDTIGLMYALGRDAEYIKADCIQCSKEFPTAKEHFDQQIKIVDWLEEHCDINCYATR